MCHDLVSHEDHDRAFEKILLLLLSSLHCYCVPTVVDRWCWPSRLKLAKLARSVEQAGAWSNHGAVCWGVRVLCPWNLDANL